MKIAANMQSFPGQVNTATTAGGQTSSSVTIYFDPSYIRTIPGMLKIAQMVSIQNSIGLQNFFVFEWRDDIQLADWNEKGWRRA